MLARRMGPGATPRRAGWRLFGAAALASWACKATEHDATVVAIDCAALATEHRAALESRAKAELLVRSQSGTLVVACRGGTAELTWHSLRGGSSVARVALDGDDRATVDRVLAALDPLLDVPAPGATQSAGSVVPVVAPEIPPEDANAPTPVDAPTPPARATPPRSEARTAAVPAEEAPLWAASAGAFAELWSANVIGVIGPRAHAGVALPAGIAFGASAVIAWTPVATSNVRGRLVRLGMDAEYQLGDERRFRLGAGASLDLIHASADGSLQTDPADAAVPGASLHALYAFPGRPFRVALGPIVGIHGGPVRVELGATEVFRLPAVALAWVLMGELALGSP
jgi:hypothetical protein